MNNLYLVCGLLDDGYTCTDAVISKYVIASNRPKAIAAFKKFYDDGENIVYDVTTQEISMNETAVLK